LQWTVIAKLTVASHTWALELIYYPLRSATSTNHKSVLPRQPRARDTTHQFSWTGSLFLPVYIRNRRRLRPSI